MEETKCPKCGGERDVEEAPLCWHCKDCPFAVCAEPVFNKGHQPKDEEYPPLADNSKIGL